MLDPEVIRRIRHIFLQPRPHVSIWQATDLLGRRADDDTAREVVLAGGADGEGARDVAAGRPRLSNR